jgi:hypothetical protein
VQADLRRDTPAGLQNAAAHALTCAFTAGPATSARFPLAITHTSCWPPRTRDQVDGRARGYVCKTDRFHRTLAEGWAFKKFYNSESARLAAPAAWVHEYNHRRPHSAIGKRSPITRLDNLAGHHS